MPTKWSNLSLNDELSLESVKIFKEAIIIHRSEKEILWA